MAWLLVFGVFNVVELAWFSVFFSGYGLQMLDWLGFPVRAGSDSQKAPTEARKSSRGDSGPNPSHIFS